jgi:hypothetical protein
LRGLELRAVSSLWAGETLRVPRLSVLRELSFDFLKMKPKTDWRAWWRRHSSCF